MPKSKAARTVGELRTLIHDLPDGTPILPSWPRGHRPHKHDPGIELLGMRVKTTRTGKTYLAAVVKLFVLE
jgi:hypothetical protein